MLRTHFKKLTINKTTSNITLEHADSDNESILNELSAIAILLGGYNSNGGRKIPEAEWDKMKEQFETIVSDIKSYL